MFFSLISNFTQYIQELATREQQEIEECSFTVSCSSVQVSASLRNPVDAWEVTPLDAGLVSTKSRVSITSRMVVPLSRVVNDGTIASNFENYKLCLSLVCIFT